MTYTLLPATAEHADAIQLRESDLLEISLLAPNESPKEALKRCLRTSRLCSLAAVSGEGDVIALFGLGDDEAGVYPWLMASSLIRKHKRAALTIGRALLAVAKRAAKGRPICNAVYRENQPAVRFLRALGFQFNPIPESSFDYFYLPSDHV